MTTALRWGRWLLLLGALAWLVHGAGVPLYDGLGFPDEPYRYVQTPPGVPHGPPAAGDSNAAPIVDGTNAQLGVQTVEQAPQIKLLLYPGAVAPPAGAARVTATATPLAPDGPTPYGPIDGNIYRVLISSDAGPVTLNLGAAHSSMTMRTTQQSPPETVAVFRPTAQAGWTEVQSGLSGTNIYSVEFRGNGDYGLVQPAGTADRAAPGSSSPASAGGQASRANTGSSLRLVLLIVAGFVVLLLAVALLVRAPWGRRASGPPPQSGPQEGKRSSP